MCDREKFELDRNEDPMSYSTSMPLDWRFGGANLVPLMGSSACSSASMVVDSYGPNFWDHFSSSQNLGFVDFNVHNNGNSSNTNGIRKDGFGFARVSHDDHRTLEMGSNPISSMFKGDAFLLPNGEGMLFPQSSSQFQTDSGFIERAARFSCFSTGNFGDMVDSYGIPQSIGVFPRNGGTMRGKGDAQESDVNVIEDAKDVPRSVEHPASKESPLKIDKGSDNHANVISQDEGKQILGGSVNNSDRAESSGDDNAGGQDDSPRLEDTSEEPSIQGLNSKKRKRSRQDDADDKVNGDPELPGEASKDNSESQQKAEQQPFSTPKASGKNAKQGPQASDPQPKDEYIHVRARRGQATNSHSLAERVRREKISDRMKFLQDLVPGCSKVTGKAVMLDEIINYVQSLQRQVEFLSMKLATINPRMDLNIEGLLAKDILQQSALGFPPEMPTAFTPLHPSQPGQIRSTLPTMANSSDILLTTIHPQLSPLNGGFKEPNQLPELWEDELHNVVRMNFATTAPLSSLDLDGTQLPASQMKVELLCSVFIPGIFTKACIVRLQ